MTSPTYAPSVAAQQPVWDMAHRLPTVLADLRHRAPLVDSAACLALRDELRLVAQGSGFLLQAGECAERLSDCTPERVQRKAAHLHHLADLFEQTAGSPVVRVGRLAGQFAKPRSSPTEVLADGTVLPSYRGDAVNAPEPTAPARRADPNRLRLAYDAAEAALTALSFDRLLFTPGAHGLSAQLAPTFISHEALLLDYERALVRADGHLGGAYASSAHLLWIGDRTRQLYGAHLEFAATVANPVAVKIGPGGDPADVEDIVSMLTDHQPQGRLALIFRLGADRVTDLLPALVSAVGDRADKVVWLCDPLHGNTVRTRNGQKTRVVSTVLREIEQFCAVLCDRGVRPRGLHLEVTPDAVTECVETEADLAVDGLLPRFESACDPRLNADQSERVVRAAASLFAGHGGGEIPSGR